MKVLLLDGYNLMYRARHSMSRGYGGDHTIVYAFFRSLRPLIEKFSPDKVYFVLEGYPKKRMELAPDYKGSRTYHDRDGFKAQRRRISDILKEQFPVSVVRHKHYECDDVLANLIRYEHPRDECIVVSSDSDFIQLYNSYDNVEVYNPIRKMVVKKPDYDYVLWKALRGDSSDNIEGFRGIGNKRALTLTQDSGLLNEYLEKEPGRREKLQKNIEMIGFHDMELEMSELDQWNSETSWEDIKDTFEEMGFFSIINEKSWQKFVNTFACLG